MLQFIYNSGLGAIESANPHLKLPVQLNFPQNAAHESVCFNVTNGNVCVKYVDLILTGVGLNIQLDRVYNSQAQTQDAWQIIALDRLDVNNNNKVMFHADGSQIVFRSAESGSQPWISYAGYRGQLKLQFDESRNLWCVENIGQGERKYFDVQGRLIAYENSVGGKIEYQYNGAGKICCSFLSLFF